MSAAERQRPWGGDYQPRARNAAPPRKTPRSPFADAAELAREIGGSSSRLATGIKTLDDATRGGLRTGRVCVVGGAPGACKTGLLVDLGHKWRRSGVHVGLVLADEDRESILVRWGQHVGLDRDAMERGDPDARAALADELRQLPTIFVDLDEDEDVTVTGLAEELRRRAGDGPCVLLVDSLQAVAQTRIEGYGDDRRGGIDAVMGLLRRLAKQHDLLVIATSELARGAYRNRQTSEQIDDLAAFKESGGVEYGAALCLVLRSVPDASGTYDATTPKNRLGPGKPTFRLRLDFARATLSEVVVTAEERKASSPAERTKEAVRALLRTRVDLKSATSVYEELGGTKKHVLAAVRALLDSGEVERDPTSGVLRLSFFARPAGEGERR